MSLSVAQFTTAVMYDVVLQRLAASPQCHAATHRSVALLLTAASSAANHSSVTLLLTATFTRARRRGCASPHSPDGARSAIFSPVRRRGRWHSARNVASIQLERPTGKAAVAHVVRAHCSGPWHPAMHPWRSWHPAKPSLGDLGIQPSLPARVFGTLPSCDIVIMVSATQQLVALARRLTRW